MSEEKVDIKAYSSDLKLPDFKNVNPNQDNYIDNFWDSMKVEEHNKTLISTVLQMNEVNNQINLYSQKKVKAELACEKLEIRVVYLTEIIRELNQKATQLRTELDVLKTIGFNIRQEMKI